jgi:hypothetical protein
MAAKRLIFVLFGKYFADMRNVTSDQRNYLLKTLSRQGY